MGLFDTITLKQEMLQFLISAKKLASSTTPITQIRYTKLWMELLQHCMIDVEDVNESIRTFYQLPPDVQALFDIPTSSTSSTSMIPYKELIPLINKFIVK